MNSIVWIPTNNNIFNLTPIALYVIKFTNNIAKNRDQLAKSILRLLQIEDNIATSLQFTGIFSACELTLIVTSSCFARRPTINKQALRWIVVDLHHYTTRKCQCTVPRAPNDVSILSHTSIINPTHNLWCNPRVQSRVRVYWWWSSSSSSSESSINIIISVDIRLLAGCEEGVRLMRAKHTYTRANIQLASCA